MSTGELAGKVVVVTGGAAGIGQAIVRKCLNEGAHVVIADIDRDGAESLAKSCGPNTRAKHVDVAVPDQMAELVSFAVEEFGGLDVMVNNAGISGTMHRSFLDDDLKDFHHVMEINLLGVMAGTQQAARHMATVGGGSIVNTTSIGGIEAGFGVATYRASKAAVTQFSKSAAIELAEHGIRVNCLAPGNIVTSILSSANAHMSEEDQERATNAVRTRMLANQPLQRQGTAEDVAEYVSFLGSDRSLHITGTVLPVDGGTVAGKGGKRRNSAVGAAESPKTSAE